MTTEWPSEDVKQRLMSEMESRRQRRLTVELRDPFGQPVIKRVIVQHANKVRGVELAHIMAAEGKHSLMIPIPVGDPRMQSYIFISVDNGEPT